MKSSNNPFISLTARPSVFLFIVSLSLCILLGACGEDAARLTGINDRFISPSNLREIDLDSVEVNNYRVPGFSGITPSPSIGRVNYPEGRTMAFVAYYKWDYADTTFKSADILGFDGGEMKLKVGRQYLNLGTIGVMIHRVGQVWNENTLVSVTPLTLAESLVETTLSPADTALKTLSLPNAYLEKVVDALGKGRRFLRDSSDVSVALVTTSGNNWIVMPQSNLFLRLSFRVQTPTGVQRRVVTLSSTVSGISDERNFTTFPNDAVMLHTVTGDYSQIKFNFASIPRSAEVVAAELRFQRDSTYFSVPIGFAPFININYADTGQRLSPRFNSFTMFPDSAARYRNNAFPMSQIVQEWIRREDRNNGFILTPLVDGEIPTLWRLKGRSSPPEERIRLRVLYLTKE